MSYLRFLLVIACNNVEFLREKYNLLTESLLQEIRRVVQRQESNCFEDVLVRSYILSLDILSKQNFESGDDLLDIEVRIDLKTFGLTEIVDELTGIVCDISVGRFKFYAL